MFGPRVPTVTVHDVEPGAFLLDVRELDEWQAGHAPEALHLPMSTLPAPLPDLPQDQQVVVVCRVGGRSEQVTAWLVAQGYDAVNLAGGMLAWDAAGRPMVAAADAEPFVL